MLGGGVGEAFEKNLKICKHVWFCNGMFVGVGVWVWGFGWSDQKGEKRWNGWCATAFLGLGDFRDDAKEGVYTFWGVEINDLWL